MWAPPGPLPHQTRRFLATPPCISSLQPYLHAKSEEPTDETLLWMANLYLTLFRSGRTSTKDLTHFTVGPLVALAAMHKTALEKLEWLNFPPRIFLQRQSRSPTPPRQDFNATSTASQHSAYMQ